MSGGVIQPRERPTLNSTMRSTDASMMVPVCAGPSRLGGREWRQAGPDALALVRASEVRVNFVAKQLGLLDDTENSSPGK